ncbi:MAG: multiheme c-type cytochrome (seleno)protein ExtKL, partial [Thermodesulfovibrionales bacterium]
MKLRALLMAAALTVTPVFAAAEFNSIDDLVNAYSDSACKKCHAKVYEQWKSSYHSQSVLHSLGGIKNFIVFGLGKEWNKPVTRDNIMRCMDCHAPQLRDASESLVKEFAELVVTAADGKTEQEKTTARKELEKLSVNCVVCHNTKVSVEKNLRGDPKKDVYYGPSGKPSSAHGTERSSAIVSSLFCGQCHGIYTPPDGDTVSCNTLYGSYQDAYRGNGGTETCQDCHMKKKDRGHTFPGAYQEEIVREGIDVDFQAAGVKMTPGKWVPTAIVNVSLANRA